MPKNKPEAKVSVDTNPPSALGPEGLVALARELKEVRDQVRADIRAAHEAQQALLQATREAREQIRAMLLETVEEQIQSGVRAAVAEMTEVVGEAQQQAVAKVFKEFEALANQLMTGHPKGKGVHLRDLL